jgi:antitoxin (DNA-binding transcriptional repressor) of toxin-antitoxin stability system
MKTVALEKADLATCVEKAKGGRVVVMRDGKPVALIVGVEGLDREQLELGSSDKFWRLIEERRKQKTITRAELEKRLERPSRGRRG